MRSLYLLFVTGLASLLAASAGALEAPRPMDNAFKLSVSRAAPGVTLNWQIEKGYYIYRDYLTIRDDRGNPIKAMLPDGDAKDDPGFGTVSVFHNRLSATLTNPPARFSVTYQGCQDGGLCYPPTTREVDSSALTISAGALPGTEAGQISEPQTEQPVFRLASGSTITSVDGLLSDGGLMLVLAGFLGFGVLLAFTPCVFPMYPIVATMLSREGERLTPLRGFVLSSSYVLALGAAFGLFGIFAAWSGQNLQLALQSPFMTAAIASLFVILALANFGTFQFQLPARLLSMVSWRAERTGSVGGAIAMGFSSALLIGPCVTAPLAGALIYIARSGDVMVGALALFALGVGKGVPLILMSTLGAKVLPRAGGWMERVRHSFGFLFLAVAIYVATTLLDDRVTLLLWALLALTCGVVSGAFEQAANRLVRSLAIISLLWGGLMLTGLALGATDPLEPLAPLKSSLGRNSVQMIKKSDFSGVASASDLSKLLDRSVVNGRPTLLYVTADWCITCRAIERSLLPDPAVASALRTMGLVSLDVTKIDEERRALMEAIEVVGPPTMLLFGSDGREVEGTRLVGDFTAPDVLTAVAKSRGDAQ